MSPTNDAAAQRSPEERAAELLTRMTLREKAGLMFHTITTLDPLDANAFGLGSTKEFLERGIVHFNVHGAVDDPKVIARHHNEMQKLALSMGAKVPITISSDPRHAFSHNVLASMMAGCFSEWPESLGMVALQDEKRMEEYCDIMRQEYVASGIRAALHPQVDLATQPLWSRIAGGLGEDADLASRLTAAYVRGIQGAVLGPESVSACVKHFPGGGPERDGYDCHMPWGAEQDYPGDQFDYHLMPFRAAVDSGVRQVMPSYGKPMATKFPEVAFGFNKEVLDGVLRKDLGFKGIILSDWLILEGVPGSKDDALQAKAWGVEHLSLDERIIMSLDAGVDQFGGNTCVDALVKLVDSGKVPESRIDRSALLLLEEKFRLGIFDNPYVDEEKAATIVGKDEFRQAGLRAQSDSLTLLQNRKSSKDGKPILPLAKGTKVFLEGFASVPEKYSGDVVSSASEADAIIVRMDTPWTPIGKGELAGQWHHGPLDFKPEQLERIAELAKLAPVVFDIYCDRPPVLGSIVDSASAILCDYGVREEILLSVIYGEASPKGKLPFDLPRSNEAVIASRCDVAFDTKDPVFRFGHGLSYE